MINFKNISIRGRLAYGIICTQKLFDKYNINYSDYQVFNNFFDKLWLICEQDNLEEYEGYINEIVPYSIIERSEKDFEDLEYITQEEAQELRDLYKAFPPNILKSMELLSEIAFGNMYGSTGNHSPITYSAIMKLLDCINTENIDLEDIELISVFDFNELHGWGEPKSRLNWVIL